LSVVVCVFLLVCSAYSDDSDYIYSSYECSSVEGADPKDLYARSCILHNVCIDRVEKGQAVWSYFVDPEKPDDVPLLDSSLESGEIASMSYRSGLNMKFDIVHDRKFAPKNFVDESRITAAFCAPTNSYAHFVLDGMFGLHWLLTHHGYADEITGDIAKRSSIDILDLCRQSKQEKILLGLFTDSIPASGINAVGHCYSTVLVGPAGHYSLTGFKTSNPIYSDAKDFDRFRNFLVDRFGEKVEGKEPSKVVVSFRSGDTMLLNVLDLVHALQEKYDDVQVVELSHTPFTDRARILSQAKVLVSVVSEDLAGMAMLPKDSTVVSIVPFGTNDRIWRPFAKRFGVKYSSWKNEDREKAAFHPEILSQYGVSDQETQDIIKADKYIPDKHNWAGEFYWSLVDTIVDVDAVTALVDEAMKPTAEKDTPAPEKDEL